MTAMNNSFRFLTASLFASAVKLLTLSELARPSPWAEEARLLPWVEETRVMIGLSDRKTELDL